MAKKPVIDPRWQTMPLQRIVMSLPARTIGRRQIRYRLFRIREGKEEFDAGLKQFIENQFRAGMNWENFTFEWDIHPTDPLRICAREEWTEFGGKMVKLDGYKRVCEPSAFTKQCMCVGYPCAHHKGER